MANRQWLIFIKTANKFQQVAKESSIGLQPLARKRGAKNTQKTGPKLVRIVDFGLSLTIAAHYDEGTTNVFPGFLDAGKRFGVRGKFDFNVAP